MTRPPTDVPHVAFDSLLPRIVRHAAFAFRGLACPHGRAEAVQEALALARLGLVNARRQVKDPSTLAAYATATRP